MAVRGLLTQDPNSFSLSVEHYTLRSRGIFSPILSTCNPMGGNQFTSSPFLELTWHVARLALVAATAIIIPKGEGWPLTGASKEGISFETQDCRLERLPGYTPLLWNQAAYPLPPGDSHGSKCPLGGGEEPGSYVTWQHPNSGCLWIGTSATFWDRRPKLGLFFTYTYCTSFPSQGSPSALWRKQTEGWAQGEGCVPGCSAPLVSVWAEGQDFLESRLAGDQLHLAGPGPWLTALQGLGPAGSCCHCGQLPRPSCSQEDPVSPAGSAGGGKERQDAQFPGHRRLSMKAAWWHQIDCYCLFFPLNISPRTERE